MYICMDWRVFLQKEISHDNTFQLTELLEMNHGKFPQGGRKHGREQAGQLTITYHNNKQQRIIGVWGLSGPGDLIALLPIIEVTLQGKSQVTLVITRTGIHKKERDLVMTTLGSTQKLSRILRGSSERALMKALWTKLWMMKRKVLQMELTVSLSTIDNAYNEISKWRKNTFLVPYGKVGREFIDKMTENINDWNNGSKMKPIALKAAIVHFAVGLQKPSQKSKAKDHQECLAKQLVLYKEGEIEKLLRKGWMIQKRLSNSWRINPTNAARVFANLLCQGKSTRPCVI